MIGGLSGQASARAESSYTFDSALGFTSNANFSTDQPTSDLILELGGTVDFEWFDHRSYFSTRYSNYFQFKDNNLLSFQAGTTIDDFRMKLSLNNYVTEAPATTDEGFSNVALTLENRSESTSGDTRRWQSGPALTTQYYYSGISRFDFDLSYQFQNSPQKKISSGFTFGATPGLLVSTTADFSRFYLSLVASYDDYSSDSSSWGARFECMPSFYLSRIADGATAILEGRKGRRSAVTILSKESYVLFSPNIWKAWNLSEKFEFKIDTTYNIRTAKGSQFGYKEFQGFASLTYYLD